MIKSASALWDRRDRLPYPMRRTAARNLLQKAAAYQVTLPNYVHQAAGENPVDYQEALAGLKRRAVFTKGASQARFKDLEKAASPAPKLKEPMTAEELVCLTDLTDRLGDEQTKYARGLPTPEELFYQGRVEEPLTIKLANREVPVRSFRERGVDLDDLRELGEVFLDRVRKPFNLNKVAGVRDDGIDWGRFAVAAEELGQADQRRLGRLLRAKGA